MALEQGREVFAVPGLLDDPLSEGCNNLVINNKAVMIRNAGDLFYQMGWKNTFDRQRQREEQMSLFSTLNINQQLVVRLLTENREMTLDENHVAHSKYHVTGEEFFLQGHFPGEPVVPGVILCEIMAQSCALLMKDDLIGKLTFYTGIDKVRFKNSVKPGDTVEVEATLTYHMRNIYICSAVLSVGGKMCVKGELSFALLPDNRNKQ